MLYESCFTTERAIALRAHAAELNGDDHSMRARSTRHDGGYTTCGWHYVNSKRANGTGYRLLHSLSNLPGSMLCERCLTTERAIAVGAHEAELSGDEC